MRDIIYPRLVPRSALDIPPSPIDTAVLDYVLGHRFPYLMKQCRPATRQQRRALVAPWQNAIVLEYRIVLRDKRRGIT